MRTPLLLAMGIEPTFCWTKFVDQTQSSIISQASRLSKVLEGSALENPMLLENSMSLENQMLDFPP